MELRTRYEARTVDEWLDSVDYSADPFYVPSDFALEFVNFIKLVNDGSEENKTPVMHYKMLDGVASPDPDVANMVFRGAAKTTLLAEYMILYLAVFGELPHMGKINFAIYVSDSIDNGVKNMRKNLEFRYKNSEFLMKYLPIETVKFTDVEWDFTNKAGRRFVVKGYGAKTGIRGAKSMGTRPQIAFIDDVVSDDDARSPTVLEAIRSTVHKAVDMALHPKKRKRIWLGTPFNANDPLYEVVSSGAWKVSVYPVCEKFPCTREEFRGAWEDRFDYDFVLDKYTSAAAIGRVDAFYQELMLRIMSEDDRLISDGDIQWYSVKQLLQKKSNFNFYITTDFAVSDKQSADFSFISVWAINHQGYRFWVDGICARQTMDKNIDDLFRLVNMYKPQSVGVEVTGQQAGFINWIQSEMMTRNCFFTLASSNNGSTPGIRPTADKFSRFQTVVPDFRLKRFFFPTEKKNDPVVKELLLELRQTTVGGFKSKHDDGLDTVSMLSCMPLWLPSAEDQIKYKDDSGLWEDDEPETYHSMSSYVV